MTTKSRVLRMILSAVLWIAMHQTAQAFYNPSTGRWLSRDPIDEAGGRNLCGFSGNDGINFSDVLGKTPIIDRDKAKCTIKVGVRIYVSTKDPANVTLTTIIPRIQNAITREWNAGNWLLDGWKITFWAVVGIKPPIESPKGGGVPTRGDEIEITNDPQYNSAVNGAGSNSGKWTQNEIDWAFAHEAGHLMGLPDDYTPQIDPKTKKRTGTIPNPGHADHMMAEESGKVVEHEVRDIVEGVAKAKE